MAMGVLAESHANKENPPTLASLQALRGIAALLVLFTHLSEQMTYRLGVHPFPSAIGSGRIGVDIFFVLSGFIMCWTSHNDFGIPGAWRSFLHRRLLRVFPVYWMATLLVLLAGLLDERFCRVRDLGPEQLVLSLLLLPQTGAPILGQAWTLVHEVRFYLMFSLLLCFPWRWASRILWLWAALCCAVLVMSHWTPQILVQSIAGRAGNYLFHPSSLQFILGIVAAMGTLRINCSKGIAAGVLLAGMVLLPASMLAAAVWTPFTKYYFLLIFTGPALILVWGAAVAESCQMVTVPRFLVWMGEASYSTYLLHLLLIVPLVWWPPEGLLRVGGMLPWAGLTISLTLGCSWLFHRAVEYPLHQFARRCSAKSGVGVTRLLNSLRPEDRRSAP